MAELNVEDWPLIGRVVASATVAVDVVLHSGSLVLDLTTGLFTVLLGQPELVVGLLSVLDRLTNYFAWVPQNAVRTVLSVMLVALAVNYIGQLVAKASQS